MNRYDRAHSLVVAGRLQDDPLLYRVALLHDAGKLRSEVGIPARWLYTWMDIFMPSRLQRLQDKLEIKVAGEGALQKAHSLPKGWGRGIYVQLHHGEIGAEIIKDLGSDEEVVRLVREHQEEAQDDLARRLRAVDDAF